MSPAMVPLPSSKFHHAISPGCGFMRAACVVWLFYRIRVVEDTVIKVRVMASAAFLLVQLKCFICGHAHFSFFSLDIS
jgi:hypothetical protein